MLSFLLIGFTGSKNLVNLLVSFQRSSQYLKHLLLVKCKRKSYPKLVFFVLKSRTFLYLKSDSFFILKVSFICFQCKAFKNDEKCFILKVLFVLKVGITLSIYLNLTF